MGIEASKLPDWICKSYFLSSKEDEPVTKITHQDTVHPLIPLSARQVFKLQKSWKGVRREMKAAGLEMFIRYVTW